MSPPTRRPPVTSLHRATWPALLRLGWPVAATLLVRISMRTVDLLVVGVVVGATGVAALGIGDAAARVVLMTGLGLGAGTISTVSQHLGAGRGDDADTAVTQTAVIAAAVGLPFALAGWFGAAPFFRVLGAEPAVVETGVTYLRIIILTAPARMLAVMLTRALQGAGDTVTPMIIRTIGTGVNIGVTVLLVPGLLGAPRLGVPGAAIGTAAGNVLSGGILLVVLASGRCSIRLTRTGIWAPATAARIVRVGLPQVLERNVFAIGAIPLNAIVLTFGTDANAGFQVGRRILLYALLPARGIATAASTYMGTHVGRGEPDLGERYGRGGLSLATAISVVSAIPLLLAAEPLARVFLRDPEALAHATAWVRVYTLVAAGRAAYGVLRGAMQGAGDTRSPLYATTLGMGAFAIGFSWLVGVRLDVGIVGVYAGILLDPAVRTALLYRWFDRGRWREAARREGDLATAA